MPIRRINPISMILLKRWAGTWTHLLASWMFLHWNWFSVDLRWPCTWSNAMLFKVSVHCSAPQKKLKLKKRQERPWLLSISPRRTSFLLSLFSFRNEFDVVDAKINALHASRTHAEVNRNLHFFFPEERLLVVLKPNLTEQQRGKTSVRSPWRTPTVSLPSVGEIEQVFKKAGFFILTRKVEKLTPEQAAHLQHAHHGKEHYEEMVNYLTRSVYPLSFPCFCKSRWNLDLVVNPNCWSSAKNTPARVGTTWSVQLIQPKQCRRHQLGSSVEERLPSPLFYWDLCLDISLRALYGKDLIHNAIDVSTDVEKAKSDIHLFFGDLDREERGE